MVKALSDVGRDRPAGTQAMAPGGSSPTNTVRIEAPEALSLCTPTCIFRCHLAPSFAGPAGTFREHFRLWGQRPLHCALAQALCWPPGLCLLSVDSSQVSPPLWLLGGFLLSRPRDGHRHPDPTVGDTETQRVRRLTRAHAAGKGRVGIQGDLFLLSISAQQTSPQRNDFQQQPLQCARACSLGRAWQRQLTSAPVA